MEYLQLLLVVDFNQFLCTRLGVSDVELLKLDFVSMISASETTKEDPNTKET